MIWDEEKDRHVMHLKGRFTTATIASKMQEEYGERVTKGMVIGRLHRLGKCKPAQKGIEKMAESAEKLIVAKPLPEPRKIVCTVSLVDLKPNQCRYPDRVGGQWKFCGLPVHKKDYCADCYQVCYKQPTGKTA